jgi:hypothetical protein
MTRSIEETDRRLAAIHARELAEAGGERPCDVRLVLTMAADRAAGFGQRPASPKQIAYLAALIEKTPNYGHPFGGDTNALLSSREASFQIDNILRLGR